MWDILETSPIKTFDLVQVYKKPVLVEQSVMFVFEAPNQSSIWGEKEEVYSHSQRHLFLKHDLSIFKIFFFSLSSIFNISSIEKGSPTYMNDTYAQPPINVKSKTRPWFPSWQFLDIKLVPLVEKKKLKKKDLLLSTFLLWYTLKLFFYSPSPGVTVLVTLSFYFNRHNFFCD